MADWVVYAKAEQTPIIDCGGKISGYYAPTEFAGVTNEAFATVEIYRANIQRLEPMEDEG